MSALAWGGRSDTRGTGFLSHLRELLSYRELVYNLTVRDLKLKYKGSVLGVAWSLLNPLIMMAIYTAVFSQFLRAIVLPNYWALVLGGILVWTFFSSAVIASSSSFVRNGHLISKVFFPVEALPVSITLANFVNFLIALGMFLAVLIVAAWRFGLHLGPSLVLLPVLVLALFGLALGTSVLIAAVTVFFRDLEHLVSLALAAWFYVTPVLYPLDPRVLPHGAARFLPLMSLNPMSWYLESFHSILYYGTWPDWTRFGLSLGLSALMLVAGYWVFLRVRPRLAEEV